MPTVTIESILDEDVPVFRLMPNVGVQVGAGTICFAPGRFTHTDAEERVLDWLRLLGSVVDLPERQFDAATALSGSGRRSSRSSSRPSRTRGSSRASRTRRPASSSSPP